MTPAELTDEALGALGVLHTSDYLLMLDADLKVLYVNRLVPGLTREEVHASDAFTYIPREAHAMVRETLTQVLATGEPATYETAFNNPEGGKSYFESRAARWEAEDGSHGVVISTSDISARKAPLFDLERFFDLTDDVMVVLDNEGCFVRVNRAFEEVMGHTEAEVFGRSQQEFVHPDDLDALVAAFSSDPEDGDASVTFRGRRADDSYVVLEVKMTPARTANRTIAVGRDVTRARALEQQLVRSQKMEAIGRLAGGIAHDFNNLLTSVLVNTHLAIDELANEHPVQELLESVVHAGNLSADLTKQLLAMSRRDPAVRAELDLNRVIERLLTMLRRTIPETVEIDFIPGRQLPKVRADGAQLEQIFLNLSLNARDAMVGGGRLTISTDAVIINGEYTRAHPWARPGRYVLIQVSDTGVGIPAELQDRIFEPFFTTKELGNGTGLGMTIAYEVVQRHEGMMHVYSEAGRGTTIKVYLPSVLASAAAISGVPEGAVPAGLERILLSEDEPLVRAVIERVLRRSGYRVVSTTNGAEALALLDSGEEFDLLFMDVVMPEMGGADVARVLWDRGVKTPIILASGYSHGALDSPEFRRTPLLQKPFDPDALLRLVREQLDHRGS